MFNMIILLLLGSDFPAFGNIHPLAVSVQTTSSVKNILTKSPSPRNYLGIISIPPPTRALGLNQPAGIPTLNYTAFNQLTHWGFFFGQQQNQALNSELSRVLDQQTRIVGLAFGLHNILYQINSSEIFGQIKLQANVFTQSWVNTQFDAQQVLDLKPWLGISWHQLVDASLKIRAELFIEPQGPIALGLGVLW